MTAINSREDLERLQADGTITPEDADEVRNFMDFLEGLPSHDERLTTKGRKTLREMYAKHYPEDYARAVAEAKARQEQTNE